MIAGLSALFHHEIDQAVSEPTADAHIVTEYARLVSNVAISSWIGYEGYQVKGVATYAMEGPDYEEIKQVMNDNMPRKGCVITVTEVYDVAPGANAGNKIV